MATVVLDRGASEEILRSKSAIFPGREVADLFEIDSGPLREEIDRNIININGQDHQRLRSLVAPHFTPKAAESHRPWVADLFSGLLLAAMNSGEFEAVEELCKPYASRVICELIGGPPEDAHLLHDWSVWVQRQFDPIALANELATLARYHIPALVVVLDNGGYGTERPMLDGPFNDVQPVDHVALAGAYGFKAAVRVRYEEELEQALTKLLAPGDGPSLVSVELKQGDVSDVLRNLTAALAKRVR
jgi:hypothetical protein